MVKCRAPAWLFAALVLAAIVPAVCVVWFMNVAMRNERFAVQEQLAEVYLKHLLSAQRQVGAFWQERQIALQSVAAVSPAEQFATIVRAKLADGLIAHEAAGKSLYPATASVPSSVEQQAAWSAARELEFQKNDLAGAAGAYGRIGEASGNIHMKARALLAEAGALLKAGDKPAALVRLSQVAGDSTLRNAISPQGTLIAPNAQLLLVRLLGDDPGDGPLIAEAVRPSSESRNAFRYDLRQQTLASLVTRLNDYTDAKFPAAQRRFLMHEVNALASGAVQFPTLAAEDLAADYLDSNPPPPKDTKLQRTPLPKVWRIAMADRSLVALYREERIRTELAKIFDAIALPGARVVLLAPDEAFTASKLVPPRDAGAFMPGWRLAIAFAGADPFAEASARQTRLYLGTGTLVVVVIALLAWLVARTVNAQLRLARLKNELVSTVSHELKTPLASMRALVDTLSAGRYTDPGQLHDYLRLIARENERLSRLIDNFLAFSRLERGRARFHFETVPSATLVETASAALGERLAAPDCHFETQLAPALPAVRGDSGALTTVLVNLLDNACKYTGAGKHIVLRVYPANGFVCFEVADNGIGLDTGEAKRIFDRFYQVDQSLTRSRGGCGLGLSIVQSIVRAHGGTVDVESEPGQGSTFRVRLPAETLNTQRSTSNVQVCKPGSLIEN